MSRRWQRSKSTTVVHNPSLGALSSIHIQLPTTPAPSTTSARKETPPELTLLSLSLPLGAAIHSIPFTGKLSKRPLLSTPMDHLGRPQGLPMIGVTSFAISQDGNRLLWGMRDGSIRVSNSAPSGGRGAVGSTIDQGEVRQIDEAHREGTSVQLLSFSNVGGTGGGKAMGGIKQRNELFVSVGKDGSVSVWSLNVPPVPGARERAPVAVKIWSARWDVKILQPPPASAVNGVTAAEVMRHRVRATAIAFDSGWIGRHRGRMASIAIGRSDGKVIVWSEIDLPEGPGGNLNTPEPTILEAEEIGAIDTLVLDTPHTTGTRSLLVHSEDSTKFSRYTFPSSSSPDARYTRTVFGHPLPDQLSIITSIAVDFDEPPPLPLPSQPATPSEMGSISIIPPRLISLASSSTLPPLSRTNSTSTLPLYADRALGSNQFGRKKYVVAGDNAGRVFMWDWTAEPEREGELVAPAEVVQGIDTEEGGNSSKITALETTEAGLFVGRWAQTLSLSLRLKQN